MLLRCSAFFAAEQLLKGKQMIYGTLKNKDRIKGLNPRIDRVLDFASGVCADNFAKGKAELDGERLFINFAEYDTHEKKGALTEAHRKYIDVFVMVEGEETVYVKPTDRLTEVTKEYSEDIEALLALTDGDASAINLTVGDVLILFPEDAHAPACFGEGPSHVKKLIGKVLM